MSLSIERPVSPPAYSPTITAVDVERKPRPTLQVRRTRLVCPEVAVLFIICMADALSSAWLFQAGLATEANPLLRGAAEAGTVPFLATKFASFIPALAAAEWWRRQRPKLVPLILRAVVVGYLAIYGAGVAGQFIG